MLIAALLAVVLSAEADEPVVEAPPSRVTFISPALRHKTDRPLAAAVAPKDEPRALWLARLAAEGRRPVRLDWAGNGDDDPFARMTMNLRGTSTQLPLHVANPDLWSKTFDALAAGSTCGCTFAAGGAPGRTPDGKLLRGQQLRLGKSAGNITLSWGASCSDSATDYSIHQGTIGSWYSHQALKCSTGGATGTTVTPAAGSSYYLIVPINGDAEGSYGVRSNNQERPASTSVCRPERITLQCE